MNSLKNISVKKNSGRSSSSRRKEEITCSACQNSNMLEPPKNRLLLSLPQLETYTYKHIT